MTEIIENKTFDEIQIGDVASLTRSLHSEDVETWASVTGNSNLLPAAKEVGAALGGFGHAEGGAVWAAALLSEIIGTRLPGPGAKTRSVSFDFAGSVPIGSAVMATATVKDKDAAAGTVRLECRCVDSAGHDLLFATATVVAPRDKVRGPLRELAKSS